MTDRNALLCRLLDRPGRRLPPASHFEDAIDPADLDLAVLCLAREGKVRRVERLLPILGDAGIASLPSCCLMIGLAGDPATAMILFDALVRQTRHHPALWINLAVLQAAWGFEAQALRSLAAHGGPDAGPDSIAPLIEHGAGTVANPGGFHFLTGDEGRFYAI